jgi:protein-S-isoprenylcysteine O-methyltransferase Ste14
VQFAGLLELMACWLAWWYPFVFRAPHRQKRASIALPGPTRLGLLLEVTAFAVAFAERLPAGEEPGMARILLAMIVGPLAPILAWTAVTHLGRQFRITAGLYHDHELVHTGPYAVVRHPIYASLLAILLSTLLLLTRWPWALVSAAVFLAGTEIRVRTEDGLLASRFGAGFEAYRRRVPAYIPWLR